MPFMIVDDLYVSFWMLAIAYWASGDLRSVFVGWVSISRKYLGSLEIMHVLLSF